MYGSDNGYPHHSVVSRLVLTFDFDSDAATFSSIPLIIKGLFKATDAPTSFSFPAFTADTSPALTVALADGSNTSVGVTLEEVVILGSPITLTGSFNVTGLMHNEEAEATVTHAAFSLCEYPIITAPDGVRVTVLAHGDNGDSTNGSQFVLFIQNNGTTDYDADGNFTVNWSRRGHA
jgi:hypothetical protein